MDERGHCNMVTKEGLSGKTNANQRSGSHAVVGFSATVDNVDCDTVDSFPSWSSVFSVDGYEDACRCAPGTR